jgi:sugar lactone lactonase YvrE
MRRTRMYVLASSALLASMLAVVFAFMSTPTWASGNSFIGQLHTISTLASTVPGNGDINPYGTVVVPRTVGKLTQGDVLISNFNNGANLQGTGTTVVEVSPNGTMNLFAQIDAGTLPGMCPGGVGLTTALVVLQRGWVIVGSLPTSDGTSATAKAGCLIVLDSNGTPVETFTGALINGPWDMTAFDGGNQAALFVTNVLNGTVAANGKVVNQGTVVRIWLDVPNQGHGVPGRVETTVIGSGFSQRTDPAALVIGPTGVGLSGSTLYVADSLNNRIAAIPNALKRQTTAHAGNDVTSNGALNDPLGLTIAPNGNILAINGNNGKIVEITPKGSQIAHKLLDSTGSPPGAGCLFGAAVVPDGSGLYFVDDCDNTLKLLH